MQLAAQIFLDATALGMLYALVAISIGLVFGVMRLVNFAHAELITLGAYALIWPSASDIPMLGLATLPIAALVPVLMALIALFALVTERLVFRPLRGQDPVTLLIASFALSYLLQHVLQAFYTSKPKSLAFGASLIEPIHVGGLRIPTTQIVTAGTCVAALALLTILLKRTTIGIQMRAAAENFQFAQLRRIPANRVIAFSFGLSGALAALTALLLVIQIGTLDPAMGVLPVIYAFFGTVIGGMGSLVGSAVGAFILGFGSQILQSILPRDFVPFRDAFIFLLVIVILLGRPQGLFGGRPSRTL